MNTGLANFATPPPNSSFLRQRERLLENFRCREPSRSWLTLAPLCSAKTPKPHGILCCCKHWERGNKNLQQNWVPIQRTGPGDDCIASPSFIQLQGYLRALPRFSTGALPHGPEMAAQSTPHTLAEVPSTKWLARDTARFSI